MAPLLESVERRLRPLHEKLESDTSLLELLDVRDDRVEGGLRIADVGFGLLGREENSAISEAVALNKRPTTLETCHVTANCVYNSTCCTHVVDPRSSTGVRGKDVLA